MATIGEKLRKAMREINVKAHTKRDPKTGKVSQVRASTQRRKAAAETQREQNQPSRKDPEWDRIDAGKLRWEKGDTVYFVGVRSQGLKGYEVKMYDRSIGDIVKSPFADRFFRTADAAQEAMDRHVMRLHGHWKGVGPGL